MLIGSRAVSSQYGRCIVLAYRPGKPRAIGRKGAKRRIRPLHQVHPSVEFAKLPSSKGKYTARSDRKSLINTRKVYRRVDLFVLYGRIKGEISVDKARYYLTLSV